jgi:hypothetical protein
MAHEQATVVGDDRGYSNVYGSATPQAGQPLAPLFGFEQPQYSSLQQAIMAGMLRSIFSGQPGTQVSGSDYLRTNPQADLLRQLQILQMIRQGGYGP